MQNFSEAIIAAIISARTIGKEEKETLLKKFSDTSVGDDDLKRELDALFAAEVSFHNEENSHLERMAAEVDRERDEIDARTRDEFEAMKSAAFAERDEILRQHSVEAASFEAKLDKVEEQAKREGKDAADIAKVKQDIGGAD